MNARENFLALCLLDALEDENLSISETLLIKHQTNPNTIIVGRGIAPLHYACGMENVEFAEKLVPLMLRCGGNPNLRSEDNMTPVHVAAIWGRANIFKWLLDKGGDVTLQDDERKTPILYAIHECQYDIIKIIQTRLFEEKLEKKRNNILLRPDALNNPNITALKSLEEEKLTPNKINYNFDSTSPYFINITHRKKSVAKTDNLFKLTEQNLKEFSKEVSIAGQQLSFINSWRDKVRKSKSRQSIVKVFHDIDELLTSIHDNDSLNFTNCALQPVDKEVHTNAECAPSNFSFDRLLDELKRRNYNICESFATANDETLSESNFIKSPRNDEYILQMVEHYVHTDDESGLVFYEKRTLTNPITTTKSENANFDCNSSGISKSTDFTIPVDYDTEALRAELTHFGEPPGPITKSTKRLYTKKLIKIKRNAECQPAAITNVANTASRSKYSVELENTIRNKTSFQKISELGNLEMDMCSEFQKSSNQQKRKWREGHLKTSFIYLLIDPRSSENLPAQSIDMEKHDVWKRFLRSIFYVGKGKSSRPYAHLYDALKVFNKIQNKENLPSEMSTRKELMKNSDKLKKQNIENRKLETILDIWKSNMGVICLHVFHNILPAEAYTREAAIIDCMGLQHLTNLKRGDYYGPAQAWTLRRRKQLGIILLSKAMHIFLAEGESQLMPSDLI